MAKDIEKKLAIPVSIATIIGVCIAAIALIPAFGQWLSPREPKKTETSPTATDSKFATPISTQLNVATIPFDSFVFLCDTHLERSQLVEKANCRIKLKPTEIIMGIALDFQENSSNNGFEIYKTPDIRSDFPCTVFIIRGPIETDINLWWGEITFYADVFDEKTIETYSQEKYLECKKYYPTRMVQEIQIP